MMLPKGTYVVDANIAFSWTVESKISKQSNLLLRSGSLLIAPDLIIPEVTNAFFMFSKNGAAQKPRLLEGVEILPRWFAELVPSIRLSQSAIKLAIELDHPAYDCFYLALAQSRDTKFLTTDLQFLRKAESRGFKKLVFDFNGY